MVARSGQLSANCSKNGKHPFDGRDLALVIFQTKALRKFFNLVVEVRSVREIDGHRFDSHCHAMSTQL